MSDPARIAKELASALALEASRILGAPVTQESKYDRRAEQVEAARDGVMIAVVARPGTTGIIVTLPAAPADVMLEVREQTPGVEEAIRDGDSIDVIVGDPIFDLAFLVEGAPSDVVRSLFEAPLRALMVELRPSYMKLVGSELRFMSEKLPVARLESAIELVLAMALKLPNAARDADLARQRPSTGALYRAGEAPLALERRQARARNELDRLRSLRSAGSIAIPTSMAICAATHLVLAFKFLSLTSALISLLLLPVSAMIGGVGLFLGLGTIADITGITALLRRRRNRKYAALAAATADPPTE